MTPSCPTTRRPTSVSCETGRRLQHLFDAGHFRDVVTHHLLDPGLQGRGGGGASCAGAAHPQTQHAGLLVEMVEQDVAAVLSHGRTDAAVEQALDLGHDLRVLAGVLGRRFAHAHQRRARDKMIHDDRQDRRLHLGPVRALGRAGDRDVVGAEEDALDPFQLEQGLSQGRGGRLVDGAVLQHGLRGDVATRQELQSVGIGRGFGLDEHELQMRPAAPWFKWALSPKDRADDATLHQRRSASWSRPGRSNREAPRAEHSDPGLRQIQNLGLGQFAGNDGDGQFSAGEGGALFQYRRDQGARAASVGARSQDQDLNVGIIADRLANGGLGIAFLNQIDGRGAGRLGDLFPQPGQQSLGLLALLASDFIADAGPVLVRSADQGAQQHHMAPGRTRAARGVGQGRVQFGSVVDDDEELPGHGPSGSLNSRRHLNRPRPKRQGPPASPDDETDGP
uniref:UBA domain-containing protein n=1 Tax=Parastrongyloides trichosuri TaxID=131310 RepID=A0A0N5A6F0_PARTI